MTRQKEEFKPITPGKVAMYVCGVTVYDYCHIGHARCYVTFDIIFRALKYLGYDVTYVRNFTDVDDKIIKRANEQGVACKEVTEKFIDAFHEDMAALGIQSVTIEPKATEHIPEMIAIIETLIKKGLAYQVGSDVFFAVRKQEGYGKLSGKDVEELESGARVDILESKSDPLDFALWKGAKPNEPKWPSPWGEGRPGWHIECSAMSMKHLSHTFDIHGGGRDLIFPHHENEIAQSEGCTGHRFANYWLHNGFVNTNAEKMSKSLGNFLTIRDLLQQYPGEVMRLFVLSAHYRSPLDYTERNLQDAFSGLYRFYETKKRFLSSSFASKSQNQIADLCAQSRKTLMIALEDDFNTAKIVGLIFELVREINRHLDAKKALSTADRDEFTALVSDCETVLGVFGKDAAVFIAEAKAKALLRLKWDVQKLDQKIAERLMAKKNRDFKTADAIRDELKAVGVILQDSPDGVTDWSLG